MTADRVKGKSFRGALNYNLEKVNKGVAKWLDTSFVQHDERTIMDEVKMIRVLRPNLAKYFYHTSINFPPHENLKDEQMVTIAKDYLEEMGFDQHQYAIFRHFDADHPHMHILVNRIGYDGTVLSDSKDYQRSEQILRKLEKQYGLTEVISSRQAKERAMTKNELEMMKRTDEPSVKMKLQVTIKNLLTQKPTAEQFISQLEAQGINVLFNQASTGFVSGISYGYEGMQFKGAHLGNAYKWQAVKNTINYEQERDRTTIYQANVRTRSASLNEPDNHPQPEQPSELSQIQKLLPEIEMMYSRALENYRIKSEKQIETTARRLNQLESTAANLSFQIQSIVASAKQIYQSNNRVGSRWVIRLYLVAILSGVCSALITMLVIWIKMR